MNYFRTAAKLNRKKCTYCQISKLKLWIAANKEIDSNGAPYCGSKRKNELVVCCSDGLWTDYETMRSDKVECEVLDG